MKRKRFGEILLEAGAISPQQLAEALEDQAKYGGKLGTIMLERRFINERSYFQALSSQLRIPAVDLSRSTIPENVIHVIPQELAEKHVVFPVAIKRTPQGKALVLAMADPTNIEIQDHVRFSTGFKVEPALALESTIRYAIRDYWYSQNGQGAYRPESSENSGSEIGLESQKEAPHGLMETRSSEPYQPTIMGPTEPEEEERPQFSREFRALLKLLAKKGIISPREYLEAFKETK